jgi:hypothetical protein
MTVGGSSGLEPRGPTFGWIVVREAFVNFHLVRALVLAIGVALRLSRLGRERPGGRDPADRVVIACV